MSEPTFSGDVQCTHSLALAGWSELEQAPVIYEYTSDYVEGLSLLPATLACTEDLVAIMKLSPDISHLDFIRACRDRIRFSPESENGAKEDSRPKLYLGFHLTDSEIFSASSNIGPGYYDIPECPDDNDEDYSSLARGEAIMRISLFLNSKSKPPAKSKRMGATFVESCPPSKDPGAIIYSDELKKWCPRNLEEKVKKYEHIFNTEILPGKNRKMMWHFDGQHYHPRWFGYEPFDAQKVLGEKLAEVVARHRPQL